MKKNSKEVARVAIYMATSLSREEEEKRKAKYKKLGFETAAVDIGGDLVASIPKIMERALVASKRNGVIPDSHVFDGALLGATREAIDQVIGKALGFSVGGKIGIARCDEHLSVSIFLSVGLLHLDEVVIGMGHRAIPNISVAEELQ